MMFVFPSQEWWLAFADAINASEVYRDAAAEWEHPIAFEVIAEPDKGIAEPWFGLLDLWHGQARSASVATKEQAEGAPYVIRAPYSRWKDVIHGELEPVKGMMQGKLKVRGDLPTIIRYAKAAQELVRLAASVPTRFSDEDEP